jgi:prepilin-type processing-associated H-X9-DG protein
MQCRNNEKQIGLAFQSYELAKKAYPPGRMGCEGDTPGYPACKPGEYSTTSAFVLVYPYLELNSLYKLIASDPSNIDSTSNPSHAIIERQRPPFFVCVSDTAKPFREEVTSSSSPRGISSYGLMAGSNGPPSIGTEVKYANNGMFFYKTPIRIREVTDGLSHTIFVGEVYDGHLIAVNSVIITCTRHSLNRSTVNPINTPPMQGIICTAGGYNQNGACGSRHPGGANFLFGDGRVEFLNENISIDVYRALSTRNKRDQISE